MSRLFLACLSIAFLSMTGFAAAQTAESVVPAPVPAAAPQATPIPESFTSAATLAVPMVDAQKSMDRMQGLMAKAGRYKWTYWGNMEILDKAFLADRDPKMLMSIKMSDMVYLTRIDLDGDKAPDMVLRLGTKDMCGSTSDGCPHMIYYADLKKQRTIVYARKMVPTLFGLLIHNRYYDIKSKGGDVFNALSYKQFKIDDPFDPITIGLYEQFRKLYPEFVEAQDRPPGFRYTLQDLDKDGRNEIIVTIMEDDESGGSFCDEDDENRCSVVVFKTDDNTLPIKLIGSFRSYQDLVLGRNGNKGYADIITTSSVDNITKTFVYSMNPKTGQYVRSN